MHLSEIVLSNLKTDGYHNMEASKIIIILIKYIILLLLLVTKKDISAQQITLKECIDIAIENHPDVKSSYLQTGLSQAGIDQAKSNFLPQVGAGIFQSGNFGRSIDRFTNDFIDQFYNATWAGVNFNMPLFTSFRNTHLVSGAKASLLAAEYALENTKNNITQAVLAAYINGLAQQENIKNALQQIRNDSIQYQRLMSRKSAGLTTKTEEVQLLNQLKSDELLLLDAQLNFEVAIVEISRLLNKELILSTTLVPLESSSEEVALSNTALSENLPPFSEAKYRLESIKDNIKATKALSYPSIDLSGNYGTFYASSNPERTFAQQLNDTRNGAISVGLNIPIFRGLQNRPQVQELKVRELILQNDLDRTKLQLERDMKLAVTRYLNLKQRYETALELYKLSEENMKFIQDQVDAGTAVMVDFILAQTNMERARTSLTSAKFQMIHQQKMVEFYTTGKFVFGK